MSNTRANLRGSIQTLIDPGTSEYTSTEINNWISDAIQHITHAMPRKQITSSTVTGTTITLTRRALELDYLVIENVYWQQLERTHPDFGDGYFDLRPTTNGTTIELGASQSSASYTVSYWAPVDVLSDDNATGLPDVWKHLAYHHAIASACRHQLADAIEAASDSELITHLRQAVDAAFGRFYDALQLAVAVDETGIRTA